MIQVDMNSFNKDLLPRLTPTEVIAMAQVVKPGNCHIPEYRKIFKKQWKAGLMAVAWPDGCGAFIPRTKGKPDSKYLLDAYNEVRDSAELANLVYVGSVRAGGGSPT